MDIDQELSGFAPGVARLDSLFTTSDKISKFRDMVKASYIGCLSAFFVNKKTSFKCYLQDQTRNPRTCCAKFRKCMNVHDIHEFVYEQDE